MIRGMSTPRALDEVGLRRVVQRIAGVLGVNWMFRWKGVVTLKLESLADADHAADVESRRRVSCPRDFVGDKLALL